MGEEKKTYGESNSTYAPHDSSSIHSYDRHAGTRKKSDPQFSNEFLHRVLESLTHPFFVIDVNDYSILLANAASGIDSSLGLKCFEYSHNVNFPCNGKGHQCPLIEVVKRKKPVVVEHIHFNNEGEEQYLEVHAYPVFNDMGDIVQIIEYSLDVTEQRWTEHMLEEEMKRSRLFLDLLAHDIANQLQIISCNVELLSNILSRTEIIELTQASSDIKNAVIRSAAVISKARGSEQLRWTPLVARNLIRAIDEACKMLAETNDDYILDKQIEVKDATILADGFLEQLIFNLLENSVVHNSKEQKQVTIKVIEVENAYHISIIDNGPGIRQDTISRIFDPNQRIGGLGLHFSKEIVNKYGGRLIVKNRDAENPMVGIESLVILPRAGCVLYE